MKRRHALTLLAASACTALVPSGLLAAPWPLTLMPQPGLCDEHIKDYLFKMDHFDEQHIEDVVLEPDEMRILRSVVKRLKRVQRVAGHGNFYLLGVDEALALARHYPRIGDFPREEADFLDRMFHEDASRYGFYGSKPLDLFTATIRKRDVVKIPRTGNYLYKGEPMARYEQIERDIGTTAYLTSGVRGIVKQSLLFLDKALASQGNLSLASRSLAPPGYSYHGVGDFDVGQKGLGADNFTEAFTHTPVFHELEARGYVRLRYPKGNLLGVRFEPWHIKVTDRRSA